MQLKGSNNALQFQTVTFRKTIQNDLIQTYSTNAPPAERKIETELYETGFTTGLVLFTVTSVGLMAWTLLLVKKSGLTKSLNSARLANLKSSQQIPCTHCQYFNANPYLKCAVQPGRVLREEAQTCSDYSPQTENT